MKVFWRSRDGKNPPKDALFSWRPFFPEAKTPLMNPLIRLEELPPPAKPVRVLKRHFFPEKKEWITAVDRAIEAIHNQQIEKIVLARRCILECEEAPDPFAITSALQSRAQNATLFCFSNEELSFLGATPERLFIRKGNQLESEAMAGTIRRGKTISEDAEWEKKLLMSEKDLREFTPVQNFLRTALSPLCCAPLSFSHLQVRKTQNVQHLYSHLSGTLKEEISDSEILERIHPTPALCGVPSQASFDWIRQLEPFQRGLYGGALGWSTKEASEWIVAIRCCLIQGRFVSLYTGTGIVKGSDPQTEWDELDLKMKLYEGIFL